MYRIEYGKGKKSFGDGFKIFMALLLLILCFAVQKSEIQKYSEFLDTMALDLQQSDTFDDMVESFLESADLLYAQKLS